jgi:hypothetical protein
MQIDLQDVQEWTNRIRHGNRHNNRGTLSLSQRFYNNIGHEKSKFCPYNRLKACSKHVSGRQERVAEQEVLNLTFESEDEDVLALSQADSSGYVKQKKRQKDSRHLQIQSTLRESLTQAETQVRYVA